MLDALIFEEKKKILQTSWNFFFIVQIGKKINVFNMRNLHRDLSRGFVIHEILLGVRGVSGSSVSTSCSLNVWGVEIRSFGTCSITTSSFETCNITMTCVGTFDIKVVR